MTATLAMNSPVGQPANGHNLQHHGGLRLLGGRKYGTVDLPLVSIIVVVRNAAATIQETIDSIISQTYPNFELLVIDGASTDGTAELLAAYGERIDYWLSEPDAGIYDAMNKGQQLAAGDYLWFINAGDSAAHPRLLAEVFAGGARHDYYYGDTQLVHPSGELGKLVRAPQQLTPAAMYKGMVVSHQAIIVRRTLAPPYDLRYRLVADQKWIIQVLRRSRSGSHTGLILANYLLGGFSDRRAMACVLEKMVWACRETEGWRLPPLLSHYLFQLGKFWIKRKVASFPRRLREAG